jgi:hypothetical protein
LLLNLPKLINGTSITPIVIENDDNNKLELIHEETKTMFSPVSEVKIVSVAD